MPIVRTSSPGRLLASCTTALAVGIAIVAMPLAASAEEAIDPSSSSTTAAAPAEEPDAEPAADPAGSPEEPAVEEPAPEPVEEAPVDSAEDATAGPAEDGASADQADADAAATADAAADPAAAPVVPAAAPAAVVPIQPSASMISGAITGVQTTVSAGGAVKTTENWCVPNGTQAGDTFSQTLPSQLGGFPAGFTLSDPDGNVVATAVISTTRPAVVTFTMTAFAAGHESVCGTATFTSYSASGSNAGTTQTLTYTNSDGTSISNEVSFPGVTVIDHSKPVKEGAFTSGSDQCRTATLDCIRWGIDSPLGPIDSGTMTDTAQPGWTFDCANVTFSIGVPSGAKGTFAATGPYGGGSVTSCSPTQITATYGAVPNGQLVQMAVLASADAAKPNGGVKFHNTATVTATTGTTTSSTDVDAYIVSGTASGTGNGTVPAPAITIVKKDVNGNDADTAAEAVDLGAAPASASLVFTITNSGAEALTGVTVSDVVVSNGTVTGLSCTFPDGSTGVSWAGPFAIGGTFTCSAALSDVAAGSDHEDVASVVGTGQVSGKQAASSNPYHAEAHTPLLPMVTVPHTPVTETPVAEAPVVPLAAAVARPTPPRTGLASTGSDAEPALLAGIALLALGAIVMRGFARRRAAGNRG